MNSAGTSIVGNRLRTSTNDAHFDPPTPKSSLRAAGLFCRRVGLRTTSQCESVWVSTRQYESVRGSASEHVSVRVSTSQYDSARVSTSQCKSVQVSSSQWCGALFPGSSRSWRQAGTWPSGHTCVRLSHGWSSRIDTCRPPLRLEDVCCQKLREISKPVSTIEVDLCLACWVEDFVF